MRKDWKTIRQAIADDGYHTSELYLDRVPMTDHIEWTVHLQRTKPNTNYNKNFGWFHSEEEAGECFEDVLKNNTDLKAISKK
jgi:hypothetical protein